MVETASHSRTEEKAQAHGQVYSELRKQAIYDHYHYLVEATRKRIYKNNNQDLIDELEQEGSIALWRAVEKFDPLRQVKFQTYAIALIRGAMLDQLRREDFVPRSEREFFKSCEALIAEAQAYLGRPATKAELRGILGSEDAAQRYLNGIASVVSIEEPLGVSDGSELKVEDILRTQGIEGDPEATFLEKERLGSINEILDTAKKTLAERQRTIIELHYHPSEPLTFRELGIRLKISESRVYQLHNDALHRLEKFLGSARYREIFADLADIQLPQAREIPRLEITGTLSLEQSRIVLAWIDAFKEHLGVTNGWIRERCGATFRDSDFTDDKRCLRAGTVKKAIPFFCPVDIDPNLYLSVDPRSKEGRALIKRSLMTIPEGSLQDAPLTRIESKRVLEWIGVIPELTQSSSRGLEALLEMSLPSLMRLHEAPGRVLGSDLLNKIDQFLSPYGVETAHLVHASPGTPQANELAGCFPGKAAEIPSKFTRMISTADGSKRVLTEKAAANLLSYLAMYKTKTGLSMTAIARETGIPFWRLRSMLFKKDHGSVILTMGDSSGILKVFSRHDIQPDPLLGTLCGKGPASTPIQDAIPVIVKRKTRNSTATRRPRGPLLSVEQTKNLLAWTECYRLAHDLSYHIVAKESGIQYRYFVMRGENNSSYRMPEVKARALAAVLQDDKISYEFATAHHPDAEESAQSLVHLRRHYREAARTVAAGPLHNERPPAGVLEKNSWIINTAASPWDSDYRLSQPMTNNLIEWIDFFAFQSGAHPIDLYARFGLNLAHVRSMRGKQMPLLTAKEIGKIFLEEDKALSIPLSFLLVTPVSEEGVHTRAVAARMFIKCRRTAQRQPFPLERDHSECANLSYWLQSWQDHQVGGRADMVELLGEEYLEFRRYRPNDRYSPEFIRNAVSLFSHADFDPHMLFTGTPRDSMSLDDFLEAVPTSPFRLDAFNSGRLDFESNDYLNTTETGVVILRIRQKLKDEGLSPQAFSEACGLNYGPWLVGNNLRKLPRMHASIASRACLKGFKKTARQLLFNDQSLRHPLISGEHSSLLARPA